MIRTEFANEGGLFGIGSPFSVCDGVVLVDVETEDLGTLQSDVCQRL